jgi:predicted component of type VI protein secretion system
VIPSTFETDAAWWGARIESGALARADFIVAVAASLPADAALRVLPQGTMFDSLW